MSAPIVGATRPPSFSIRDRIVKERMDWGANALSAPTTPGNRMAKVDRSKVDPQLLEAAEGMEAMFLDYMMKVMRQTVPKSDMDLESAATEIYRGMMDSETAQRAAKQGGIGIADQIIAYMESQSYTGKTGPQAPGAAKEVQTKEGLNKATPSSTGGTREGLSLIHI